MSTPQAVNQSQTGLHSPMKLTLTLQLSSGKENSSPNNDLSLLPTSKDYGLFSLEYIRPIPNQILENQLVWEKKILCCFDRHTREGKVSNWTG